MFFNKKIFAISLLLLVKSGFGNAVEEGFKALSIYDYFKAKQLFYKVQKKKFSASASYGLSVIFSRSDNPFSNSDSAAKYISISYNMFRLQRAPQSFSGFSIDSSSIRQLCDSIAFRAFEKLKNKSGIKELNAFLNANYLASTRILGEAQQLRDELEFNEVLRINRSDSTQTFIQSHPESALLQDALLLKDREDFEEQTKSGKPSEYIAFIKKYPANAMLNSALEKLYLLFKQGSDVEGLKYFVAHYPFAPQINEAWKLLFSLTVKSFTNEELEKFLREHPAFPFKNSILKELSLNRVKLYAYEKNDIFGYIDSSGKISIKPQFDAVSDFSEGLSVVSRNDSVFFINKENENPFAQIYSDAYPFHNGIAAVKKGSRWNFINRQGQSLGETFDDIAEMNDAIYVVKKNGKYGALDAYGQFIIEPKFDKLGDFKNGFAYYVENGKYGFVSKNGFVQRADFTWISDFGEDGIGIFRQENAYGIINNKGQKILEPQYDLILKGSGNIFVLVKNGQYGFFSGEGCYLSQLIYDFQKEKPAEFYTNGRMLKLLKKNEQTLMDLNGKLLADFGTYDEMNFAESGLLKLRKKNKYGYADKKLSLIIPFKYESASNFSDSLAIVSLKGKTSLISISGKEIFSTEGTLEKAGKRYYLAENEQKDLLDKNGQILFMNIENIQKPVPGLLVVTLNNNEIRLLKDEK